MKQKEKKYSRIWKIVYGILLVSFTVYTLLDTFVLTRVYSAEGASPIQEQQTAQEKSSSPKEETAESSVSSEPVITDTSYSDDNLTITITTYREYDTDIYAADIQLSSSEYLQTALACGAYGKNVTAKTSVTAAENNAILAINGDYYGAQESGYVIRNGVLYRSTSAGDQEDLVLYEDGSFEIINEKNVTAEELLANGAQQVLSFGPGLLETGEVTVSESEEVGKAKASNPRTAIAVIDDLHYLFIVSDGRTSESAGLSLYQLACFTQSLGAVTAYNLDGGGSSTMYFNGSIVNNPTTDGNTIKERSVSDIVYIAD